MDGRTKRQRDAEDWLCEAQAQAATATTIAREAEAQAHEGNTVDQLVQMAAKANERAYEAHIQVEKITADPDGAVVWAPAVRERAYQASVQAHEAYERAAQAEMESEYAEHNAGVQADLNAQAESTGIAATGATEMAELAAAAAWRFRQATIEDTPEAWAKAEGALRLSAAAQGAYEEAHDETPDETEHPLTLQVSVAWSGELTWDGLPQDLDSELVGELLPDAIRDLLPEMVSNATWERVDEDDAWTRTRARMAEYKRETDAANGIGSLVRSVIDRHPELAESQRHVDALRAYLGQRLDEAELDEDKDTRAMWVVSAEGPAFLDKRTWTTHTVVGVFEDEAAAMAAATVVADDNESVVVVSLFMNGELVSAERVVAADADAARASEQAEATAPQAEYTRGQRRLEDALWTIIGHALDAGRVTTDQAECTVRDTLDALERGEFEQDTNA